MLNKIQTIVYTAGISAVLLVFMRPAHADEPIGTGPSKTKLTNPLKSDTIEGFLNNIVDVLVIFALPIIIFFIMYAGFLFVTARGNEGQIEKARAALLWAVVGGVIVMGAKVISEVIQGTAQAL